MSLAATTLRFWWLGVTLVAVPSCGGERIRLGDETAGAGATNTLVGGTGGAGGGSQMVVGPGGGDGGADSGAVCPRAQVLATEVLFVGDSWVQDPTMQQGVRDLARAAGAIGPNDDYVDSSAAASDMATIAKQYEARERGTTKVKVLLMDGGTWDPIAAQMSGASVPAAIDAAVSTFQQFLTEVASDGTVEHIVYFLVPELATIPGVSTMRPQLQQACALSAVPCDFLDLQPLWQGHPEYTGPSGIQASAAGGTAIADAIWAIMQAQCIAQ
jgi:hypothetical protein